MKRSHLTRRQFVESAVLGAGCLAVAGATREAWASPPADINATLTAVWSKSKDVTLAFAEAMPEEKYIFRPSEDVRTFAEQLLHIAGANFFFMSQVKGAEKPPKSRDDLKAEGKSKADVIKLLEEAFDYGSEALSALTAEQAKEELSFGPNKIARWKAVLFACDHTTHHRGQTVIYLRMKGIKPPQYGSGFFG